MTVRMSDDRPYRRASMSYWTSGRLLAGRRLSAGPGERDQHAGLLPGELGTLTLAELAWASQLGGRSR